MNKVFIYYENNFLKYLTLFVSFGLSSFINYLIYIEIDRLNLNFSLFYILDEFTFMLYLFTFLFIYYLSNLAISFFLKKIKIFKKIIFYDQKILLPKKYYWKKEKETSVLFEDVIEVTLNPTGKIEEGVLIKFKDENKNISDIFLKKMYFENIPSYDRFISNILKITKNSQTINVK